MSRAALVALVLWAPSSVASGLLWLAAPGPPDLDPTLRFAVAELVRAVPFVTVLGALASVLAGALWRGAGWARRPLQAALVVGAVVPVALGIRMAAMLPLPAGLTSPGLWRLLFASPALLGALLSGVPAVMAVLLLERPESRRFAAAL